jgi:hypothetical protein
MKKNTAMRGIFLSNGPTSAGAVGGDVGELVGGDVGGLLGMTWAGCSAGAGAVGGDVGGLVASAGAGGVGRARRPPSG